MAIPHAFYLVDDTSEMVRIIDAFLSDEVFFAIVTFRRKWVETTLVRRNTALDIDSKVGTVQVISWSGKHDKKFRLRLSQKRRPTRG